MCVSTSCELGATRATQMSCSVVWPPALFFALLLASIAADAEERCQVPAGKFVSIQGDVDIEHVEGARREAEPEARLCEGDTIHVGRRSRAAIQLMNQAVLRIDQNTTIRLVHIAVETRQQSWIELVRGAIESFSHKPWLLRVTTPHLDGDVDGTEFYVRVDDGGSTLIVMQGRVRVSNEVGGVTVGPAQGVTVKAGTAPTLRNIIRPRDAVQWAMHYPPVLYLRPEQLASGPGLIEVVREAIEAYWRGDLRAAMESIAAVPETVQDPGLLSLRASLLLSVGRVEEAEGDIERALRGAAGDGEALALRSIISLVRNQREEALEAAESAVAAAPNSATALIALSYAHQASYDLEGARASLEQAVAKEPGNALAWARLAELWSAFGYVERALTAARQAVALEPMLSRTQSVLGFAFLAGVETAAAKAAFDEAITLDQADPLPRLGLGLAKIREGDLEGGRRQIEVAASLNPNDALVRSYLGKSYYEEKRTPLDLREYEVAKQLDPNDPTPWLYGAIAKQTTNRPVEALQDLETSIALNQGRAVYRSRLLLDSDLAARSASIARIYSDLGFQRLALVEGWKSVNTDPTNFSAHRLLADSYAALPRHEIARVSELLQSQLLQPLNLTPIQPRLAESNLFLIAAAGPGWPSFNEFSSLFNRDRTTVLASALVGGNDTFGAEGVIAGINEKTSFSLGVTRFDTDGFRVNNDQRDELVNAFVQQELTPATSIQAEYRYREGEQGDLQQRFFPEDFFSGLRDELKQHTLRVGGRHAFSPGSVLLGSLAYQQADARIRTDDFPVIGSYTDLKIPERSLGGELSHLVRSKRFNLRTGFGFFHVDAELDTTVGFDPPGMAMQPPLQFTKQEDIRHANVYTYADVGLADNVRASVGASYDSISGDLEKDQFNPKLGITWAPSAGTVLRAAAFRVLKRTLINDQTLEPTQVAGFNQFYDDANLTESWRYGAAIDQKLARDTFAGIEVSKRDLKVPFLDLADDGASLVNREADWKEYGGLAYVLWTPSPRFAVSADYRFDRFDRDERFGAGFTKLDTHRFAVGMSFFGRSGLTASLTPTYWQQEGEFEGFFDHTAARSGSDKFWTVDATVGFRLPKRYGFVTAGATNLFDEEFRFFEVDASNPTIQPDRTFFVRVTLALP